MSNGPLTKRAYTRTCQNWHADSPDSSPMIHTQHKLLSKYHGQRDSILQGRFHAVGTVTVHPLSSEKPQNFNISRPLHDIQNGVFRLPTPKAGPESWTGRTWTATDCVKQVRQSPATYREQAQGPGKATAGTHQPETLTPRCLRSRCCRLS